MILNYPVTLSDWRSTTAFSETPPLFMTVGQSVCLSVCLSDWLTDWLTDSRSDCLTKWLLHRLSNRKNDFTTQLLFETLLTLLKISSKFYRRESGVEGIFRLDSPATSERIRMACVDQFTQQVRSTPLLSPQLMPMANTCCPSIWSACR